MVEISFEVHEIGAGEVEEEIGGFGVEFPERVSCAPEGVLFVNPFAFFLVLLYGIGLDGE